MTRTLYCFDGDKIRHEDPHAVQIEINDFDQRRWAKTKDRDRRRSKPDDPPQTFIRVQDRTTGHKWWVAPYPCGLGCRCGAIAYRKFPQEFIVGE